MKADENKKVTKGIIFVGCSFTWGQGLYYYSNLPTLKEPEPDRYDEKLLSHAHKAYMYSKRYPRLVANHFDTFEIVHPNNGGSNRSGIEYWEEWDGVLGRKKFDFREYSAIVFQLTQFQRNSYKFEVDGKQFNHSFHFCGSDPSIKPFFLKHLESLEMDLDEWIKIYVEDNLQQVKGFLQKAEMYGLKTVLFTWPKNYLEFIKDDPWFMERLVDFNYNGETYLSIEELMKSNQNLEIKYDLNYFVDPPKDHHPGIECHEIMAKSVIKKLQNKL